MKTLVVTGMFPAEVMITKFYLQLGQKSTDKIIINYGRSYGKNER